MTMAYMIAMRSPDPSTKVGAVIVDQNSTVVSMGYNGWTRGTAPFGPDDPRLERPVKYLHFEHAERNSVYNACIHGKSPNGCTIYVTMLPCADCARAIIQTGINRVVYHADSPAGEHVQRWDDSHRAALDMFSEVGVTIEPWSGAIVKPEAMFSGQVYSIVD